MKLQPRTRTRVIGLMGNIRIAAVPLTRDPTLTVRTDEAQAYAGKIDLDRGI